MAKPKKTTPTSQLSKFKPASDDFEFRQFPFYWIMQLGNRYTHKMEIALKTVNMNITSWRVSMILREHGALSITEVAAHAAARLPTITKTVYKMQEKGWVDIKPRENDGRVSIVTITRQGLATVQTVIDNTTKVFDDAFNGLTKTQLDELNNQLQTIFSNLSNSDN